MTQNQGETYFHDLGHGGSCTAFYRGCFGNLFWGTCTPMFDGFSRVFVWGVFLNVAIHGSTPGHKTAALSDSGVNDMTFYQLLLMCHNCKAKDFDLFSRWGMTISTPGCWAWQFETVVQGCGGWELAQLRKRVNPPTTPEHTRLRR